MSSPYDPDARVVWVGIALGHPVRAVAEAGSVIAQTLVVGGVWGAAPPVLATAALQAAVLALSVPPRPSGSCSGLSVYLDLEQRALAADGGDEALAETYHSVMDTVWRDHLSFNDRQWLNARGDVSPVTERIGGREDGDRKA